ncbi:Zn-dependent protease (includes SpoIVFB) [Amycolatopsis lurida]|uniref:Peptidase M50 n=1 Tax=Amycolatopsis lurida NRRL 2430 TaxID=1460371 RepID=A0A2P2G0V6_AMYLU|nr:site-2 protease family protein [Amycolatopsis lurida]KFU82604.1 peptidase M50 [Amycolatopsis lurida NRRL 2430]SEE08716.1 Zn-dependent protease (includes SpoIVFB) [Amycolatopsis lurida]
MRPSPIFLGILAVTVLGGVLAAFGDNTTISRQDYDPLITIGVILLVAGGWVASLTLHEFGHAVVAFRGGDHSVAHKGYLSMDVRKYTDPILSIVLPLVFLVIGGIPLPGGAVWIEHGRLRSRGVQSWVSLAGPLSNLGVGVLLTLVIALVPMSSGLVIGLSFLALLQVVTFILNILPIPGLDGWGAIEPYLSPGAREFGAKVRPWAPLALFAVLIAVPGASPLFWDVSYAIFDAVGGFTLAAQYGQDAFMFWK